MTDKAKEILLNLYNISKEIEEVQIDYSHNLDEKFKEMQAVKELQELGYLIIKDKTIGSVILSITYAGETIAETL